MILCIEYIFYSLSKTSFHYMKLTSKIGIIFCFHSLNEQKAHNSEHVLVTFTQCPELIRLYQVTVVHRGKKQ